jgi:hypothetical protein
MALLVWNVRCEIGLELWHGVVLAVLCTTMQCVLHHASALALGV